MLLDFMHERAPNMLSFKIMHIDKKDMWKDCFKL